MKYSSAIIAALVLAACAPVQTTSSSASVNLPRNQEMYGVVHSLEPNATNVRSDTCVANDHACVLAVLAQQKMDVATVSVMGLNGANLNAKVLSGKSQVAEGDIVRFRTLPSGQDRMPEILDVAARRADRKPGLCDWEGGSPANFSGGVVCKGWSYKLLKL